ncbi:MAG: DUF3943 domain-containing protein [Candidatus Saccharicenans sp.]
MESKIIVWLLVGLLGFGFLWQPGRSEEIVKFSLTKNPELIGNNQSAKSSEKDTARKNGKTHTGRALLESAALITGSTIDYWRHYADFQDDWQFKFTWKDQKRRFFTAESPKFDSNAFWFNWTHAASGATYYNMARTNGLNNRVSFLFSFGLSTLWETACEWREIISINDMVFTSFGGPAIGEPLFQISSFFTHKGGLFNRFLSLVFDPFLPVNNWFDRKKGPAWNSEEDGAADDFSLFLGVRKVSLSPADQRAVADSETRYAQFNFGLDMDLFTIPGYLENKSLNSFRWDTLSVNVFLDFNFSPAGLEEFNIKTKAVLFGYVHQRSYLDGQGQPHGNNFFIGYGTYFEVYRKRPIAWYDSTLDVPENGNNLSDARFYNRPTPTEFTDKLSTISPMGLVFNIGHFQPSFKWQWNTGIYGDFAMVNALAYNFYSGDHDVSGVKSTLLNWGYYYAVGITISSGVKADWHRWSINGDMAYESFDSIQGQDRYQFLGVVTEDFKIHDDLWKWRLKIGYRIPKTPLELALVSERVKRNGRILEVNSNYLEHRLFYQLRLII